jgi:hypothetical protein
MQKAVKQIVRADDSLCVYMRAFRQHLLNKCKILRLADRLSCRSRIGCRLVKLLRRSHSAVPTNRSWVPPTLSRHFHPLHMHHVELSPWHLHLAR